jgi:hypothetical protein
MKNPDSTSTDSEKSKKRKTRVCNYSEKTPYKSMHKAGYVTAGNYIAELIFQKRNEFFNSGKNAESFWLKGNKLHNAYKGEVIAANKLLKEFKPEAIIQAIKSPEAKFILKLSKKDNREKLIPIIRKFQDKIKATEFQKNEKKQNTKHMKSFSKHKNVLEGL